VIRSGEVTGRILDDAIQRALVRAAARRNRDSQRSLIQAGERMAFALLAAAIGYEFTNPSARPDSERVLVDDAHRVIDVAQRIAARGLASSPLEPERVATDRTGSLSRAAELVERLSRLGGARGPSEQLPISEVLKSFVELMARYVQPWAALHVTTEGAGYATVPRAVLTCALAAVLANAIERIRGSQRSDGLVQFRSGEREDCVLIEVEHNGEASFSDLRPGMLEVYFGSLAGGDTLGSDLAQVREHLRHVGGELLVDSGESKTLIRIFLPTSRAAALPATRSVAAPSKIARG
jgi:C4-dicarboxylate-specific signal transduction histidine kinase